MIYKICVITGARTEYGLLRWVMQGIMGEPKLTLQVIAICSVYNLYSEAVASQKVVKVLKHYAIDGITKKAFYALPASLLEAQ